MSLSATIPLLILIGFLAAVLASMMGLGGGLVAVPLIMLVIGGTQHEAAKLISYVSIIALSIVGAYKYWKQKRKPQFKAAFWILLGVVPATVISGIYITPLLDGHDDLFHFLYSAVVVIVVTLINIKDKLPKGNLPMWSLPLFGLVIGMLSGTIGLSGGVIFVPLLVVGLSMTIKEAAVTSLILKLTTASANVITNAADGSFAKYLADSPSSSITWYLPLIIVVGSFLGSQIGPMLNKKVTDKQMRIIFNVVMFIMFVWEILNASMYAAGTPLLA